MEAEGVGGRIGGGARTGVGAHARLRRAGLRRTGVGARVGLVAAGGCRVGVGRLSHGGKSARQIKCPR